MHATLLTDFVFELEMAISLKDFKKSQSYFQNLVCYLKPWRIAQFAIKVVIYIVAHANKRLHSGVVMTYDVI